MSGRTHQIQSINSCLVSINEVQCFLKEILQWVKINKIIHKWINFYSMDALSCNAIKKGNILWKAHTWYSQVSVQACHNLVSDECIHTLKIYPKMYHTMCKSFFQPLSPLTPTRKKIHSNSPKPITQNKIKTAMHHTHTAIPRHP